MWVKKRVAFACLLLSVKVSADDSFGTIVVNGGRDQASDISEVANTSWFIEKEDLQKELDKGADLKTALGRLIPSLDMGSSSSRSNVSQGLRGRPALVMVDGVSMNSTRGISRQFDSIHPFNIERVEVISGATSIYGAGARGGIINIITKKGSDYLAGELLVKSSFDGEHSDSLATDFGVSVSGGAEKIFGRLSVSGQKTGATYDAQGHKNLIDSTQTDTQYNSVLDVMGTLTYAPSAQREFVTTVQSYTSEQNSEYGVYLGQNVVDAVLSEQNDQTLPENRIQLKKGLKIDTPPATERMSIKLQYKDTDFYNHLLLVQTFFRKESFLFYPFPADSALLSNNILAFGASEQNTTVTGSKLLMQYQWNKLKINYGGDFQEDHFSAKQRIFDEQLSTGSGGLNFKLDRVLQRYPSTSSQYWGAFLQSQYQASERLMLNGGLRFQRGTYAVASHMPVVQQFYLTDPAYFLDRYQNQVPDIIPAGRSSSDVWLFNLGMVYELNDKESTWVNWGQGVDIPSPSKFFKGRYDQNNLGPNLENYNTNVPLKYSVTNSFEYGFRRYTDTTDFQIAFYYSVSDKTFSVGKDLTLGVGNNETHIQGVETGYTYLSDSGISLNVNAHLLKSREVLGKNASKKQRVFLASPSKFGINMGKRGEDWGVNLGVQSLITYKDSDGQKIDGYTLTNFSSHKELPYGRLTFSIDNLANVQYRTVWSAKAQDVYSGITSAAPGFKRMLDFYGRGRTYSLAYQVEF